MFVSRKTYLSKIRQAGVEIRRAFFFNPPPPPHCAPDVIAYAVGIAWAAPDELEYIATNPDKDHSFFVDEFDNLYKFVPKIVNNICQEFNSQPRN